MAYIDRNNMPQERFGSSYEVLLDPLGSYKQFGMGISTFHGRQLRNRPRLAHNIDIKCMIFAVPGVITHRQWGFRGVFRCRLIVL